MGSVADVYTTGDNDPEIEAERYVRHYLYCDGCGSFDLENWIPDGDAAVRAYPQWLGTLAIIAVPMVAVYVALSLGMTGCAPWTVLTAAAILVVGMLITGGGSARSQSAGMRCRQCKSRYAHGSAFFNDLDANPRQLSVGDVPRPLGRSPFLRGKSVE